MITWDNVTVMEDCEVFPREQDANIEVEFRREGEVLTVSLAGDADLFSSSLLKKELSMQMGDVVSVVFDMENVDFADSHFIRLLLFLRKRLGGISSVTVVNPKPMVRRVFEVTGLDKLFIR